MLNNFYENVNELKSKFYLPEQKEKYIKNICNKFPMKTNDYYLSLIEQNNYSDPVFKMSIPSEEELRNGGSSDTSGESENTIFPGVQHKYQQTLLILSSTECFMYCRHCFRKRLVGHNNEEVLSNINIVKSYIEEHPAINNVLISGGDAFCNSNKYIQEYLKIFSTIKQLDFIRFGTRAPVVFPQRIICDENLFNILKHYSEKKQLYVITQFNHPNEVTPIAIKAINILLKIGVIVKNQTVLLKGVNDSPQTIAELLSRLTACGVIPYYIFQCRPVQGVLNHFQVPLKKGLEIVDQAKNMVNGQGKCVRYVLSHVTGKIEVLGVTSEGNMVFKYHQAKDCKNSNRIFAVKVSMNQAWI